MLITEKHFQFTDEEFEEQFENCSMSPDIFTHSAHLRLAWIHVTKYGLHAAIENITGQLRRFVDTVGAAAKYNHTITVAAIKAVSHFISKSSSTNFKDFMAEFPRLHTNFRDLINSHYKIDVFNSPEAKQKYIEPDLVPFD
jgi:hypothetical protein